MIIQYDRVLCERDPMLYGQFLEHFHRQIYGGVYCPVSINGFNVSSAALYTIKGNGIDDYNDIGQPDNICIEQHDIGTREPVALPPHSVNVLVLR